MTGVCRDAERHIRSTPGEPGVRPGWLGWERSNALDEIVRLPPATPESQQAGVRSDELADSEDSPIRGHADVVIVGGGTAGAIVAARLVEADSGEVLMLEAGPNYGPATSGRWPPDLLDASSIPASHDWAYTATAGAFRRPVRVERARVIGGCSSHNGCTALWGGPSDWNAIAGDGQALPGWGAVAMAPVRDRVLARLGVHVPGDDAVTPYHAAWIEAARAAGYDRVPDLNASERPGIGLNPINIRAGLRMNTAFAWLDPVRDNPRLTVAGDTLVDRLVVKDDRVVAVEAIRDGARQRIGCDRVVMAAGAYGTPAILQRSGIGSAALLERLDIPVNVDLPGVGANLQDHPSVLLRYAESERLVDALARFAAAAPFAPEEQTVLRGRSSRAPGHVPFDIHLYPFGGTGAASVDGFGFVAGVACMTPRSRGAVRIVSADPLSSPEIDLGLLIDRDGHDRAVLAEGIGIAEAIVSTTPLRSLLGERLSEPSMADRIREHGVDAPLAGHYYHPVGTCRMGPGDRMDVCDGEGRILGLANGYVADASLFPVIPKANTALPVAMVAERISDRLIGQGAEAKPPARWKTP
ncbi:MAG TPA: GMC family oxidoreductase [Thermomicrobiales bacterium]|nr:GMC family oxidoreductase [Thermomicrobiales bacterium]